MPRTGICPFTLEGGPSQPHGSPGRNVSSASPRPVPSPVPQPLDSDPEQRVAGLFPERGPGRSWRDAEPGRRQGRWAQMRDLPVLESALQGSASKRTDPRPPVRTAGLPVGALCPQLLCPPVPGPVPAQEAPAWGCPRTGVPVPLTSSPRSYPHGIPAGPGLGLP